jgi:hypothetical protein
MPPARNDPCPCGSAKKYKKCCAGGDMETRIDRRLGEKAPDGSSEAYWRDRSMEILSQRMDLLCRRMWQCAQHAVAVGRVPVSVQGGAARLGTKPPAPGLRGVC